MDHIILNECSDSAEFSNFNPDLVACGTYQLHQAVDDGEQQDAHAKRNGGITFFKVNSASHLLEESVGQVRMTAVFDLAWSPTWFGRELLLAACADGSIRFVENMAELHKIQCCNSNDGEACGMVTFVSWPCRNDGSGATCVIASQSDGCLSLVNVDEARLSDSWKAHELETWVCSFRGDRNDIVYSGADDGLLKTWDIRSTGRAVATNKDHTAGVTSIKPHPNKEHYLATGSYDEIIRIWDDRSMKSPLQTSECFGGGIWRLKWHPRDPEIMLAACMHAGFATVKYNFESNSIVKLKGYGEDVTTSEGQPGLAYGASWHENGEFFMTAFYYAKRIQAYE